MTASSRLMAFIDGPLPESGSFSASHTRVRAARACLLLVMPAVLVLVTLLTTISLVADPDQSNAQIWIANGAFWAVQLVVGALVLTERVQPVPALGAFLVLGGIVELLVLPSSPEPVASSSSLLFFVVAGAYFLPGAVSAAFTLACAAAVTVAAHRIDAWGEHFLVPTTSFVLVIVGLLSTFVASHSRRTERRLEQAIAEEREARELLEQVDTSRDRLIANVSHELRTPLTATIGAIETLLRTDVTLEPEQRDRLLQIARDGGLRLLVLVEDLLTIGTTRPDSLNLAAGPERLATIARDAVMGLDAGNDREIRIVTKEQAPVHVDRMRMLQVVTNLVVNAIRHGRGDVLVQVGTDGGRAVLVVLDDGDGVPSDHVDELFLPFARFSLREDSTGLGLAICRAIVEAHGGTIRYERTEDDRTAFLVELPVNVSGD